MKKFNLIFILLFSVILAGDVDILKLKNGDLIKGKIIENKINEHIKIELQGGSILTYTYDQIESIDREQENQAPAQTSRVQTASTRNCYQDGLNQGQQVSGGGAMLGGLGGGLVGGFIGWGIAWGVVAMGNPQPQYYELPENVDGECSNSFRNGYKESALKVKKTNVNVGGAVGTLLIVLILSSSE